MSPKPEQAAIENLDLSGVQERLKLKEKFDTSRAEKAIGMYRQFLAMVQTNPDQIMVPNEDVDAAWHHHILDTVRYEQDCKNLFGRFLHHNPSFFGTDAFFVACEATQKIHDDMFKSGEVFLETSGTTQAAWCGGMLKETPELNLKPGWCGGMLKETPELNLKPGWCGGMLKDESDCPVSLQ